MGRGPGSPGAAVSRIAVLVAPVDACLLQCSANSLLADTPLMQEGPGGAEAWMASGQRRRRCGRFRGLPLSEPWSFPAPCSERRGGVCSRKRLAPAQPTPRPRAGAATGRAVLLRTSAWCCGFREREPQMQGWWGPPHAAVGAPQDPLGPLDPGTGSQQASCPFVTASLCKHTRGPRVESQMPWGSPLCS